MRKFLKEVHRYLTIDWMILLPLLVISILINTITMNFPDSDVAIALNNFFWWVGNICFYLLITLVLIRTISAFRNIIKKKK
jgi:hypothetical protein